MTHKEFIHAHGKHQVKVRIPSLAAIHPESIPCGHSKAAPPWIMRTTFLAALLLVAGVLLLSYTLLPALSVVALAAAILLRCAWLTHRRWIVDAILGDEHFFNYLFSARLIILEEISPA